MAWGKLTDTERAARNQARDVIILAANRHKLATRVFTNVGVKLYGTRQLQRAVFACRQNRLVSNEVLAVAGFAPNRHRGARPVPAAAALLEAA